MPLIYWGHDNRRRRDHGQDWRHHSLLSIGAIDFDNPENEFYGECRIFEGAKVDPGALVINRFSEEDLNSPQAKTDRELVEAFLLWTKTVGDTTIAGVNPSFDRDFIRAAALRHHLDWPLAYRTVDLHSIAYSHMLSRGMVPPSRSGRSDLDLPKVLAYCGLPQNPKAHNAHDDALFEAEAFSRLIYGRPFIEELIHYPVPSHLKR